MIKETEYEKIAKMCFSYGVNFLRHKMKNELRVEAMKGFIVGFSLAHNQKAQKKSLWGFDQMSKENTEHFKNLTNLEIEVLTNFVKTVEKTHSQLKLTRFTGNTKYFINETP